MKTYRASKGTLALVLGLSAFSTSPRRIVASPESYPYGSEAFQRFVQDSYRATGNGDALSFHRWMDTVAPVKGKPVRATHSTAWTDDLQARREKRNLEKSSAVRADAERQEAAELHRWEKRAIPRFSLDRGFEFASVVNLGERQCLLQSVLLAALLQKSGIDAGAVMVFRNGEGQESNIGHVVTLVKLANGHDVLADASHKEPFVRHTGLFVRLKGAGYRFVEPAYAPNSPEIVSYRMVATGKTVPVRRIRSLDTAFLRSQFAYYRGERTPDGVLSSHPTPAGLGLQATRLRESLAQCPANPLSTYMLGMVCQRTGHASEAFKLADRANRLYRTAGWVPQGMRDALAQARAAVSPAVARGSRSSQSAPDQRG